MRGFKQGNQYKDLLGDALYRDTPKAVLAAIVASYILREGFPQGAVPSHMLNEWWALHWNGIVPQRPPGPEPRDEDPPDTWAEEDYIAKATRW